MSNYIGIRHEDKYLLERRSPLTPRHVEWLVRHKKLDIIVQSSEKRIFRDEEYRNAGAEVSDDLKKCSVVFGVKEMPVSFFEPNKTYVFFAHVIKGQSYNMPMLKRMMELKCNLIEYEKVIDEQGKRLIFFGKYAGLAGMINSFWALGLRMKDHGYISNLLKIRQAHTYPSLKEAREDISAIGQRIAEKGIPNELLPFVIGFTGYGNVSQGAQEICGLLPVKEISPEKLLELRNRKNLPNNIIYKVIFHEEDLVEHTGGKPFDLHDYYANPHYYRSVFEKYVPHLSMLINCIYWDKRYPKLITKEYLKKLFAGGRPKLSVIGDISCDVEGSIECTLKPAEIDDPIYIYNVDTEQITMGHQGDGMLVMAVDILPAELPRDASNGFGDVLVSFVKPIADADFEDSFEDLDLPKAIKKGLILHRGELTPDFKYLEEFLIGN
ncbi:MAG: bifunctional lysine ketoglutarate reductase /saccharopine dehydrogenase family protein [Bacteroidetes bacterium]|nr:bifunctional lysine ketoglutarate reductase /saccharopine dehydrogenase family protein [Bacteroidota bacterium]